MKMQLWITFNFSTQQ